MPRFETIRCEKLDGVAVLTLDRPERLNAINLAMARELPEAWEDIKGDPQVLVVIVTGAGDKALCSGFDLAEIASEETGGLAEVKLTAIQNRCFKPVITAVNGLACGGGLHFVCDSDLLLCAEHASFFDTHVGVGLVAGLEPITLARRMPLEPVLRMALCGRSERLDAERARRLGLVSEVVPLAELMPRAHAIAQQLRESSPAAVAATKRAIWQSLDVGLAEAQALGWRIIQEHATHPDVAEGAAAFRERRRPRWAPAP